MDFKRLLRAKTALLLAFWLGILPLAGAEAASAPVLPSNAVLDLSSRAHTFAAPNARVVDLRLGAGIAAIAPGQAITPSEYLAIMQLYHGHSQNLVLNSLGMAVGGRALLTPQSLSGSIQSLVVPRRVALIELGFGGSSPFTVNGNG